VLGYPHAPFLLLDESGPPLHHRHAWLQEEGIGSEVMGKGIIGMAAARATTIRVATCARWTSTRARRAGL
jgi:hypothetical protein